MDMMEAELTTVDSMFQSWDGSVHRKNRLELTVDFEHFYQFWTSAMGNFTDPKGFCDLATVRPIWQSPAARKSVDCVGESDAFSCPPPFCSQLPAAVPVS